MLYLPTRVVVLVAITLATVDAWGKWTKDLEDPQFLKFVRRDRLRHRVLHSSIKAVLPRGTVPDFRFVNPKITIKSKLETDITCPQQLPKCASDNVQTPCAHSCEGLESGRYTSCKGCEYFKTCDVENNVDEDMKCASITRWNARTKNCDWPVASTCTPCTNLTVDLRHGVFPESNPAFQWLEAPAAVSSPSCDNTGLLQLLPPPCAKKVHIRVVLKALGSPNLHLAGHPLADGYGDMDGGSHFGPHDSEIHLNNDQLGVVNSQRGGYKHHWNMIEGPIDGNDLEMCIQIQFKRKRNKNVVQIKGGIEITFTDVYLLNKRLLYIAMNRVISQLSPHRSSGLCLLEVSFSC